eukprot:TRINITY_DN9688_c0_g1_i2.p1 TRINITY_DN9688_c0_g1~~TRINITY_DN9688_c0_g1_i2.p1  ORF type:complete len:226 (-),score=55.53 TRINITY_DN9688_c0_g1_i2:25-702(-)
MYFFFFFKQKTAYEIMPSLVGSEMCIRDRCNISYQREQEIQLLSQHDAFLENLKQSLILEQSADKQINSNVKVAMLKQLYQSNNIFPAIQSLRIAKKILKNFNESHSYQEAFILLGNFDSNFTQILELNIQDSNNKEYSKWNDMKKNNEKEIEIGIWLLMQVAQILFLNDKDEIALHQLQKAEYYASCILTVSYTHLTLPTICSVQISVVAVSLKKKKKNKQKPQ